ncbi:MAG TPA: glycosyltransferase family 4 protein [Phnomibacter sp.]|nr:glycosyltransferase family 4 protein [Phnomibacter sp.]
MPFIFIHTHPIQYFAPLYQYMAAQGMPLQVWYCAPSSNSNGYDTEFGTQVSWDIPLLQGYTYRIFKNEAGEKAKQKKNFKAFNNPEMLQALQQEQASVVVVHGWNYSTYVSLLRYAKKWGHQLAFRGETNYAMEMARPFWHRWLRKPLLRWLLKDVDYFLCIGTQSKRFYEYLGIHKSKLVHTPYAVDNRRFQEATANARPLALRQQLSIPENAFVWLNSGKYIQKKRPLDLLQAFAKTNAPNTFLVMMGEGALRSEMEQFIRDNHLQQKVLLTGFINQQEVPAYYAMANAFVMCSDYGETWGLSVNEAMNFLLPVLVSNRCGCAIDLVDEGKNGFVFNTGDTATLAAYMQQLLQLPPAAISAMGNASLQKINTHSYHAIYERLLPLHA